jgi:hypothetical protein
MAEREDGGPAFGIRNWPSDKYQLSPTTLHEGHNPEDPRVLMIEEMAINQCDYCAHGYHRWRDRQSGEFVHVEEFGYDADSCEAHNTLRIAVDHGVPIYTGAELQFDEEEDEPTLAARKEGGEG